MNTTSPSLADRFTWLIDGLCRVIGAEAHKRRMEAALAWAIWNRVRMLGERLIALAERGPAGRMAVRRRTPPPGLLPPGQGPGASLTQGEGESVRRRGSRPLARWSQ
jgi:hypothetical protein